MRFLLDENADFRLVDYLASQGHDVSSILRDHQPGLPDRKVLKIANHERRVLITNDKDFGELIVRRRLPHAGVILFRLQTVDLRSKERWLQKALDDYADQLQEFLVVSERGIRIRRSIRSRS
jgi:predicted nuclease of predicted toxin-antitoxin system